jgi:hypothetical protein
MDFGRTTTASLFKRLDTDKNEDAKMYENEIKKLNHWDYKLLDAQTVETDEIKRMRETVAVKNTDLEGLNFFNHFRASLKNKKLLTTKPAIELINQLNENQNTILLQNMSLSKLKFNFDVFKKGEIKQKERLKDIDENDVLGSITSIVADDGARNKKNKELYKLIIKDTILMEMGFRKQ